MTLIKTSLLNGIAVIIKMLTLLGLNKILAIYVGPAGYAALGQFQNAVQMITTLASGAINTGVTKYTAEYYEEEAKQHAVWSTAGTISLISSVLVAIAVIAFNKQLAGWFLKDESLSSVFTWFAATLVLFVFNTLLLAILNGKKEIQRYVTANIAGSLFALAVTTVMAIQLGLYGALVALAIYQSLTFFVTLALTYKASWFKLSYLFGGIDNQSAKNLAKFTVMAITSAIAVPMSHILIRNHLGETLGWEEAGYWEAMWRLSSAYLMIVTMTLSVYYLPRLSELSDPAALRREIAQGYRVILPVAVTSATVIYVLRDFIIWALFTDDFEKMRELFGWQMVGDSIKIASWLLGFIVTAKAYFKVYVASEVLFSMFFYLLVYWLTPIYGLEATVIGHAINYSCHFAFMVVVLRIKRIL